ncbi:hypothetical protein BDZ97DRAFT_1145156 [Flammula alnicola]|nr:hypothetical protein BDZ97DRAFT_1145156 [Flammula alnicola]
MLLLMRLLLPGIDVVVYGPVGRRILEVVLVERVAGQRRMDRRLWLLLLLLGGIIELPMRRWDGLRDVDRRFWLWRLLVVIAMGVDGLRAGCLVETLLVLVLFLGLGRPGHERMTVDKVGGIGMAEVGWGVVGDIVVIKGGVGYGAWISEGGVEIISRVVHWEELQVGRERLLHLYLEEGHGRNGGGKSKEGLRSFSIQSSLHRYRRSTKI